MKVFKVSDPVLKTEPLFVLDCSFRALAKLLRKRYRLTVEDEDERTILGKMMTFSRPPWRVVWVKTVARPQGVGALLHEIFHLVTRICGDKGIPIHHHLTTGECGDETAAYLFEFFAVSCLKKLKK